MTERPAQASGPGVNPEPEDDGPVIRITNEFATVEIRRVNTRNGVRLEIHSPRLGYTTRLDAMALESLTWQSPDVYSHFLRDPFGPDGHH